MIKDVSETLALLVLAVLEHLSFQNIGASSLTVRSTRYGTGLLTEDARRNARWKADFSTVKPAIIRLEASARVIPRREQYLIWQYRETPKSAAKIKHQKNRRPW